MFGKNNGDGFQFQIGRKELNLIRQQFDRLPPASNEMLSLDRDDMLIAMALEAFSNYQKSLAVEPNFKVGIYEKEE